MAEFVSRWLALEPAPTSNHRTATTDERASGSCVSASSECKTAAPAVAVGSGTGRSWWCGCGANIIAGWPSCPSCGHARPPDPAAGPDARNGQEPHPSGAGPTGWVDAPPAEERDAAPAASQQTFLSSDALDGARGRKESDGGGPSDPEYF